MESSVPSSFDVQIFTPSLDEMKDFSKYLRYLEEKCNIDCISKVMFHAVSRYIDAHSFSFSLRVVRVIYFLCSMPLQI